MASPAFANVLAKARKQQPRVSAESQIYGELEEERGSAAARQGERDETRGETLEKIRGFDPAGYARMASEADFGDLQDEMLSLDASRSAGMNRRGMFGAGMGVTQQNRAFGKELARVIGRNAFTAAQLEGQNIDRMGRVASEDREEAFQTRGRYLEGLGGTANRELEREQFEFEKQAYKDANKKKKGGLIGSIIGGVGGAIIGGPGGAAAGAKAGGTIGSWF